jgi:hypothetical protein
MNGLTKKKLMLGVKKKTIANENMIETFYKIESKKAQKRITKAINKGNVIRQKAAE